MDKIAAGRPSREMHGRLVLSQTGWLLLEVPNAIMRGIFATLREPGIELPSYEGRINAHISVMTPEDVAVCGGPARITERGQTFAYTLGQLDTFTPRTPGISRVWVVQAHSPSLGQLRKSYGLSAQPEFPFHLTVAQRKVNVLGSNDVTKGGPAVTSVKAFFAQFDAGNSDNGLFKVSEFFADESRKRDAGGASQADGDALPGCQDVQCAAGTGESPRRELSVVPAASQGITGASIPTLRDALSCGEEKAAALACAAACDPRGTGYNDQYNLVFDHLVFDELIKDAAVGIPDRRYYGDPAKIQEGSLQSLVVQKHLAERAGQHYDVRMGDPQGLYSWAARHPLPGPGQKRLIVQQPMHAYKYKDFEGIIPKGQYGAGKVSKQEEGELLFTSVTPEMIHFTTAHRKHPERFVLFKPQGWGEKDWMLMNVTPTKPVPYAKTRYSRVPADRVEQLFQQMRDGDTVEAKVDGASTLVKILKDGVELLSYRTSKETGRPILQTERVFHGRPKRSIPADLVGTVLKGELYGLRRDDAADKGELVGTDSADTGSNATATGTTATSGTADQPGRVDAGDGSVGTAARTARGRRSVIDPQELGGILNATVANAIRAQRERGIDLKTLVYDIQQLGNEQIDSSSVPRAERRKMIERVLGVLDPEQKHFHISQAATTPEEAAKLWADIQAGTHPLTREGIVYHPAQGRPSKAKLLEDADVHVRDVFPGEGKYQGTGAGGFAYSLDPDGPVVGRVGTGFTDETRREMLQDPSSWVGRVARIHSQQQLPSGAYRAPAFLALHESYPMKTADDNLTILRNASQLMGSRGRALHYGRPEPQDRDYDRVIFTDDTDEQARYKTLLEQVIAGGNYARRERPGGFLTATSPAEDISVYPATKREQILRAWALQEAGMSKDDAWAQIENVITPKVAAAKHIPTIAVDLDGTLATHFDKYDPNIIPAPRPGARKVMQDWREQGYRLIIFTVRGSKKLVADWLEEHDIPYDYINENPNQPHDASNKLLADVYVDDRGVDGSVSWTTIGEVVDTRLSKKASLVQRLIKESQQQMVSLKQTIAVAARQARKPVSDAQADAGNYKKGHVVVHGLNVTIETKAGERRRPEWPPLKTHYGYIRGTTDKDEDHMDVFLGPDPDVELVYVVDQVKPDSGRFDEHKSLLGFRSLREAKDAYLANYEEGWQGLGNITPMTIQQFKQWLQTGDLKKPVGKQAVIVKTATCNIIVQPVGDCVQLIAQTQC